MKSTVEALKSVYLGKGGALTDTYPDIADGAPVGDYVTIPDMISAFVALDRAQDRSGGGVVYVTVNGTTTDNQTVTYSKASMNAGEIAEAVTNGNAVILRVDTLNTVSNAVITQSTGVFQYSKLNNIVNAIAFVANASDTYVIDSTGNVIKDS